MKTKILFILSLAFLELGEIVAQPVGSNEDIETSSVPDESSTRAVLNSENVNIKENESTTEPNSIPLKNNSTPNESIPNNAVLNSEDFNSKDDLTTEPNSRPFENNSTPDESSPIAVLNSEDLNSKDYLTTGPNPRPFENNSTPDESTPNAVLNSKNDLTTEPNSRPLENNSTPDENTTNAVLNSINLNSKEVDSTTKPNSVSDKSSTNVVLNSKENVLTTEATSIPLDTGGDESDLSKSDENSADMTQIVSDVNIIVVDPGITENNLNQNDPDPQSSENESDPPNTGTDLNETTDQSVVSQTTSPLSVIFVGICRLVRSVRFILPILLFTYIVSFLKKL